MVISIGANDTAPWKTVELDDFRTAINDVIARFGSSVFIVVGPPPVDEERLTRDPDRDNKTLARYAHEACLAAKSSGARFVDTAALFAQSGSSRGNYLLEDGLHLNDAGYEVLIPALADAINSRAMPTG